MDRTVDLTIAALIFLAGTAGLVSGEYIGDVETTKDMDGESAEAAPFDVRYLRGDANDDGSVASETDPSTVRQQVPKVGRNDPCPCGSGKKYKHCHGRLT